MVKRKPIFSSASLFILVLAIFLIVFLSDTVVAQTVSKSSVITISKSSSVITPPPSSPPRYLLPPFPVSDLACGDCDGDHFVTIVDAQRAAKFSSGLGTLTEAEFIACNVAGVHGGRYLYGSEVSILDALTIARYVVGLTRLDCGRPIYFIRDDDPTFVSSIYKMDSDGTNEVLVKAPVTNSTYYGSPVLSYDGQKISYEADIDLGGDRADIYVADSDGQNEIRLTFHTAGDFNPSWSPDGRKIAFETGREYPPSTNYNQIYVMNSDGSNQIRISNLTNISTYGVDPSWSPDGRKIAFVSGLANWTPGTPENYKEIFIMNPDGSNPQQLTNNSYGDEYPSWSPDGQRILFVRFYPLPDFHSEMYIMDADGSNERLILNRTDVILVPSWSHDGRILYDSFTDIDSNNDIYRMDEFGGNIEQLTNTSDWDWWASH